MQEDTLQRWDGRPARLDFHGSCDSKLKRLIDVSGSCVGLGIMAALLPLVALAIRLDSPGPVFFRQQRVGLGGRPFWMYKFRSMVVGAASSRHLIKNDLEDNRFFKSRHDPRITRVGAFLRRTSLDELPQFWNVLGGEMSLVGTRPPLLGEVALYEPHHWQRLAVKPGMTGLWQICGRSTIADFERVVELDLTYQRLWSVTFDLRLLLRTIAIVFTSRGAY